MAKEYAPGIPASRRIQKVPSIKTPSSWEFGVHRHEAERAGEHFDLRLGDPNRGHAHSWALRALPKPGERRLAIQQPTHTLSYMDFKGPIPEGYGKGLVDLARRGKTEILSADDRHVRFNVYSGKDIEEYALRRMKPKSSNWVIQNVSTTRHVGPGQLLPSSKPKYKLLSPEKINVDDSDTELQAKIDGAHVLYQFKSPGSTPRVVSYRPTERETGVIEHTQKLPGFQQLSTPKSLKDTILRGELYATDETGRALPAARVGGLLNANVWKSREKQEREGNLKPVVFDVVRWRGEDVEDAPYSEKRRMLGEVIKQAPWLSLPRTATTPDEKRRLIKDIKAGKEPSTDEGVIEWAYDKSVPRKSKFLQERDVVVRSVFPESGTKRRGTMAGGFEFSYTKDGPIIGRVGTGMSHTMKTDLLRNPSKYVGLTARIKMQRAPEHYAPRAPSFHSFHLDQDIPEDVKTASLKLSSFETPEAAARARALNPGANRVLQQARQTMSMDTAEFARRNPMLMQHLRGTPLGQHMGDHALVQNLFMSRRGGESIHDTASRLKITPTTESALSSLRSTPAVRTPTAVAPSQTAIGNAPTMARPLAGAPATAPTVAPPMRQAPIKPSLPTLKPTVQAPRIPRPMVKPTGGIRSMVTGLLRKVAGTDDASKDAMGFYKGEPTSPHTVKFKTEFQGIPINVDRPKGFIMKGVDSKGNEWARRYKYDYGFIPKTLGGDEDGLDVFIGPDKNHPYAYWAVQRKEDGSFDEYKVFLGFPDREAAISAYRQHIPKKYFMGVSTLRVEMMKAMLGKVNPDEKIKRASASAFFEELMWLMKTSAPNINFEEVLDTPKSFTTEEIARGLKQMGRPQLKEKAWRMFKKVQGAE